ncbi:AraC family transcriptional regulator [Paenibacillus humicola]|uniref:AraC family transcriptional regulator n=1 Tax=Paenibacillus humicola TaxID=3110540 RepID=UPI00237A5C86|nr:AraC family transcriptional regulator [Paenibacillus humicola]
MQVHSLFDSTWVTGDYRPSINAYYYRQWVDYQMAFHAHCEVEIMYVISGTCTVETRDKPFAMRKGDAILLDAGVPHRLLVGKDSPCRMLNVEFTFSECEGIYPSVKQLAAASPSVNELLACRKPYMLLHDPTETHQTLKSLVMELDGARRDDGLINLLISQLLVRVARLAAEKERSGTARQTEQYVRAAIEYLHQHYDCDIQARDVAAAVNLHPVYLQRIFKRSQQVTMTDYLIHLRMEKAKMLLARTEIPIAEIADYVGVSSRQYFSELFKKSTGMTPAAYRKSIETFQGFDKQVSIPDNPGKERLQK